MLRSQYDELFRRVRRRALYLLLAVFFLTVCVMARKPAHEKPRIHFHSESDPTFYSTTTTTT